MSWTLKQSAVGSASGNTGTTATATFGSAVAIGDVLMVIVQTEQTGSSQTVTAVTDSASNSYAAASYASPEYGSSGSYMRGEVWLAIAETAATPTVTVTVSEASFINVGLAEFSVAGALPVQDSGHSIISSTTGTIAATAITPTGNDLVIAIVSQLNTSNPTWTNESGYGTLANVAWSSTTSSLQVQYIDNVTANTTPSMTSSQAVAGALLGLSYKEVKPVYTLTGPTCGVSGGTTTFTVTPGATIASDTITFSDGGAGGTFTPTSLTFSGSGAAQNFRYTQPLSGSSFTITLTSAAGGSITGSPWTYPIVVPASFHTTGALFLATPANNLFSDQASASISFFVKYNSCVVGTGGFYGDLLTKLYEQDVRVNGTDGSTPAMNYQMTCTAGGGISYPTTFVDTQVYHVAITWSPTEQVVWINGRAATTTSLTSLLTGSSNVTQLELGWQSSNGSTLDVQVGQLAIWNGYALTSTDIANLKLQAVSPLAIGGGATSYWPFGGTPGNAIALGDVGLADVGSGGNTFTSMNRTVPTSISGYGTPAANDSTLTYGPALVYSAPAAAVPYVTKSGSLVVFGFVPKLNTSEVAYPTAVNANPVISVNGTVVPSWGPVWTMTSNQWPFIAYQLETPVTSSDVLTCTAPDEWVITTVGATGASLSGSPLAIANHTGSLEPGFGGTPAFGLPVGGPTLPLGFDVDWPSGQCGAVYSTTKNWLHRGNYDWTGALTSDANGHPETIAGTASNVIIQPTGYSYIDVKSIPMTTGTWTLIADEKNPSTPMTVVLDALSLGEPSVTITFLGVTPGVITGGVEVGKQWQWDVQYVSNPGNWAQGLRINFTAYESADPGPWTLENEFLFAPSYNGPALPMTRTNPLSIDSNIANQVTTPSGKTPYCLRFVDNVLSYDGFSNMIDVSDLLPPTTFGWNNMALGSATSTRTIAVQSVRPYSLTAVTGTPGSPYLYTSQWGTATGNPALPYVITPSSIEFTNPYPPGPSSFCTGEIVTTAPHNLKSGQILVWGDLGGITITNGNGGGTVVTTSWWNQSNLPIWVTGESTFVFFAYTGEVTNTDTTGMPGNINNVVGLQALTGSVSIYVPDLATIPYECTAAVTGSLANTNIWVNVPVGATDLCVASIAQRIRDNFPPGRKVYVEYSNEVWSHVAQYFIMNSLATLGYLGTTPENAYAFRASQVHANFVSVFNQVDVNGNTNRGGEIVHLFGSQWAGANITDSIMTYVATYNAANPGAPIQVDAVAVAPYEDMVFESWPDPSVAATVNVTGGGQTGGLLAAGTYYVSYTWTDPASGLESGQGSSLVTYQPNPSAPATGVASGTTGSLPAGNYIFSYTYVAAGPGGETTVGSSRVSGQGIAVAAGDVLTVSFNDGGLPSWAASRNLYLAPANAPQPGTETLYATGVTASTYTCSSASWTNGTTTQAAAEILPAANSTGVGTAFTIAAGNVPAVTIAFPALSNWMPTANIYLTQSGSPAGPAVKYLSGVTTTTVNLAAANAGSVAPGAYSRIPSVTLASASIWNTYRNSVANGNPMTPWTRPAYMDLFRQHLHYSSAFPPFYSAHFPYLASYTPVNGQPAGFVPALVGYKGGIQDLVSGGVGPDSGQLPFNLQMCLTHDLFYDPSMYDAEIEYLRSVQEAGLQFINVLAVSMPLGIPTWTHATWGGQPWGRGDGSDLSYVNGSMVSVTNKYVQTTGQGQHQHNVVVKMQGWRDWADVANVPGTPTPYNTPKHHRARWIPPRLGLRFGK